MVSFFSFSFSFLFFFFFFREGGYSYLLNSGAVASNQHELLNLNMVERWIVSFIKKEKGELHHSHSAQGQMQRIDKTFLDQLTMQEPESIWKFDTMRLW